MFSKEKNQYLCLLLRNDSTKIDKERISICNAWVSFPIFALFWGISQAYLHILIHSDKVLMHDIYIYIYIYIRRQLTVEFGKK